MKKRQHFFKNDTIISYQHAKHWPDSGRIFSRHDNLHLWRDGHAFTSSIAQVTGDVLKSYLFLFERFLQPIERFWQCRSRHFRRFDQQVDQSIVLTGEMVWQWWELSIMMMMLGDDAWRHLNCLWGASYCCWLHQRPAGTLSSSEVTIVQWTKYHRLILTIDEPHNNWTRKIALRGKARAGKI